MLDGDDRRLYLSGRPLTHPWYLRQRLGLATLMTGVVSGMASGMIAQTIYIANSEHRRVFAGALQVA